MKRIGLVLVFALLVMATGGFLVAGGTFAQTASPTNRAGTVGPGGMMGGSAFTGQGGRMGSSSGYGGMMIGSYTPSATPALTISEAKDAATKYLATLGSKNLTVDEIMLFDNNAYVAIKDSSTGVGAFELLVNPGTKQAFPEYGPNMMWNLQYGHMYGNTNSTNNQGGMMGGNMMGGHGIMGNQGMMSGLGQVNPGAYLPGKMSITSNQALKIAQSYLDKAYPSVQVDKTADEFPGYYTIEVTQNGIISGMLSVNGFTGQVWYHTWHGQFIQKADYGI